MVFRYRVRGHRGDPMSAVGPEQPICSAKGCPRPAAWDLLWNNPKLHTPERRKVWLACDEHRPTLADFLGARGFLQDVEPHDGTDRAV